MSRLHPGRSFVDSGQLTLKISGGQEDMLKHEFDAFVRCILMLSSLKIISVVD
jgi:hypothetical protein